MFLSWEGIYIVESDKKMTGVELLLKGDFVL